MAQKKNAKTSSSDELNELDRMYMDLVGDKKEKGKKKNGTIIAIICAALALLVIGGLAFYLSCYGNLLDSILPMGDITVAGIELKGMTKKDAKTLMATTLDQYYTENPMTIQVLETKVELTKEAAGIELDVDEFVNALFRSGASGLPELLPYLTLNTDVVQDAVNILGSQYNADLRQSTCAVNGEVPDLGPDANADDEGKTLSVTMGTPAYGLDTQLLYQKVLDAYSGFEFLVIGECSTMEPSLPDLKELYNAHYVAPVDAVMDGKTFVITPETYGYCFDLDKAMEKAEALAYGETVEIPFERIAPEVTGADLAATLYCDLLGEWQTPYSGADNNNRNTNLGLACDAINGVILLPGEEFAYNETLGERTPERGWKPAGTYVGGLTVDTYGGGICQVSSTLYYSTLFADLEIVERWPHGFISNYTDPGMDASVSWNSADLRFKNNTNFPIRIDAERANGYVTVRIMGTDEKDYYVKMYYDIVSVTPYETVYREMAPDNPEGYKDGDVIVTPYKGYKVIAYKYKYDKETDNFISSAIESNNTYSKRDEVICKIVDPSAPEGTAASTEPPSA